MKCKVCKRRAVINLRAQNRGLCESCFDAYVLDRVELTIKRYKMFSRGQRILVAVSGGKDSLGLWDILARLGYEPAGLFVDVGITRGNYSIRSREVVESFAQSRGLELVVESLEAWWGRGLRRSVVGSSVPPVAWPSGISPTSSTGKWAIWPDKHQCWTPGIPGWPAKLSL